jgi:hypothetical protein
MLDSDLGKIVITPSENTIADVGELPGLDRALSVKDQAANVIKGMSGKFLARWCIGHEDKWRAPYPNAAAWRAIGSDVSVASKLRAP